MWMSGIWEMMAENGVVTVGRGRGHGRDVAGATWLWRNVIPPPCTASNLVHCDECVPRSFELLHAAARKHARLVAISAPDPESVLGGLPSTVDSNTPLAVK